MITKVYPGDFNSFGAYELDNGIMFTIASKSAQKMTLHLFRCGKFEPFESIEFPKECVLGNVFSMVIEGMPAKDLEYAYSVNDKPEYLLDYYAKAVADYTVWGEKQCFRGVVLSKDLTDKRVRPLIDKPSKDSLIIYELHSKGFTANKNSNVSSPGSFNGLIKKISYIKNLGVNAVELLPVFSFDKTEKSREFEGERLYNFWGYNTVGFFSPHCDYASDKNAVTAVSELKKLVECFHDNNIAVILDVVFNHTAESDENGPVISFKGFDDDIFYIKNGEGEYANFAGCGNSFNCNNETVSSYIKDVLEYWVTNYGIDGFRFDLASVFYRDENGEITDASNVIKKIESSPVLKDTYLIAEAWDASGMYQVGNFTSNDRWMEWNGIYRDDLRRFLKGDENAAENAIHRISGSADIYDFSKRGENSSINFITCHDGFTLYDLYSYNKKHNLKNGWNNTDGDNAGYSWNCGYEGETEDKDIKKLRQKMVKNALTALLISRGPLMIAAGDEILKSRGGNNNPYCQDNSIEYINWDNLSENKEIHDFTSFLINFRNEHEVIRHRLSGLSDSGFPDISYHHGVPYNSECSKDARLIGIVYAGKNNDGKEDIVYVAMNMYWEDLRVVLPALPTGYSWEKRIDTAKDFNNKPETIDTMDLIIEKRSIVVLDLTM